MHTHSGNALKFVNVQICKHKFFNLLNMHHRLIETDSAQSGSGQNSLLIKLIIPINFGFWFGSFPRCYFGCKFILKLVYL